MSTLISDIPSENVSFAKNNGKNKQTNKTVGHFKGKKPEKSGKEALIIVILPEVWSFVFEDTRRSLIHSCGFLFDEGLQLGDLEELFRSHLKLALGAHLMDRNIPLRDYCIPGTLILLVIVLRSIHDFSILGILLACDHPHSTNFFLHII